MKIYIDGLFYTGSGIGRYYSSLIKEFSRRGIEIITTVPSHLEKSFNKDFNDFSTLKPIFVNYEKFSLKGFFKQGKILKSLEKEVDLFFYPHINLPSYIPDKLIVTIHDLIPYTQFWDRNLLKKIIFKVLINRAINKSYKIICISETVKRNVLNVYNRSIENKIVVIYRFIDIKFYNPSFEGIDNVKKPYILFVGNRKKHKNIEGLIKAFLLISDHVQHNLVIVGAKDKQDRLSILIEKSGKSERIFQIFSIPDEELLYIYKHADLLILPSFFEGFGLPPLEAVSMGCPALVSDIPVFKEIFNEDILYVNPYSVNDIAEKILYLLSNNEVRLSVLKKQIEILKRFNKEKIIDAHLNLFRSMLDYK